MNKIATASAPGYAAFALALWMNGMVAAGWFATPEATFALLTGVVLGGGVMAVAGFAQCARGHALDACVFLGFA